MASPYARPRGGAGSAYARPRSTTAPAAKKSSGGFLGEVAHVVAKTASGLGEDALQAPGGVYHAGRAVAHDVGSHPFETAALALGPEALLSRKVRRDVARSHTATQVVVPTVKSVVESAQHPLRRPDQTLLNILGVASLGAGSIARIAAAGDAIRAGDTGAALKALATKAPTAPRLFRAGEQTVGLQPSRSHLFRAAQAVHDRVIRNAAENPREGLLSAYAQHRLSGSLAETQRYVHASRNALPNLIAGQGRKLDKAQEAALRLTSQNVTPEEALGLYERERAKTGALTKGQQAQVKLLSQVQKRGLVRLHAGRVIVDPKVDPRLAALDEHVATAGALRDQIIADTGERSPQALRTRLDAPGKVAAGGEYVAPTPGRLGLVSKTLERQRGEVERLQGLYDRALAREAKAPKGSMVHRDLPEGGTAARSVLTERLGGALSVQKEKLARMETSAANRVEPTGIVGGNAARPGRTYVSEARYARRIPKGAQARGGQQVLGAARPVVGPDAYTGEALKSGLLPKRTSQVVSDTTRQAVRKLNTVEFRSVLARTGSDVRRTSRDTLVNTQELKAAKIPDEIQALLGRKVDRLADEEVAGHTLAFERLRQTLFPGSEEAVKNWEARQQIGSQAPEGYRWVDRRLIGKDLLSPPVQRFTGLRRFADSINAAQTAATVYYKLGHVATRYGTNAVTNIVQGSADPVSIARSVALWKKLSPLERTRALGLAGQGGFAALPQGEIEGNLVTRGISVAAHKGAQFWARNADAPFRFNSLAYEARKAGIHTPAEFRKLLADAEHVHDLPPGRLAQVDRVLKRSNREAIAYDRLGPNEKAFLTRVVWFYPWVAGSTRFAVNAILEHPLKAAALGNAGAQAQARQAQDLGAVPTFAQPLFKVGGTADLPLTENLSTVSPFATPGELALKLANANRPTQFEQFSNYLNPALAAAARALFHLNEYGEPSKSSTGANVLAGFGSTTPLYQLYEGTRGGSQAKRIFPSDPRLALYRALFGSVVPRPYNRPVGEHRAQSELRSAGR